jgi:hypothetical protein
MLEKKNKKLHTSLKLLGDELREERNLDRLDYLSQESRSIVANQIEDTHPECHKGQPSC